MWIVDAEIYTPDGVIAGRSVAVADGRIAAIHDAPPPAAAGPMIKAHGMRLVPGFIDLQLNGGFGHDFTANPDTIWPVAAALPRFGVTSFLPTIITSPPQTIQQAQAVLAAGPPSEFAGAAPLGLHLEGPFLHPQQKGAHNPAYLRAPDLALSADWSPQTAVSLVTLAPELPGAAAVIAALTTRGVVVSAGHSTATLAEAKAGFDAGVRYGTHLFNAMPPLHHREPGLAGALLADERPFFGLIVDGVHVHDAWVRLVWRLAADRLTLVSDAMAALGMPDGAYRLGSHDVTVQDGRAFLADGTLAGSVLPLDRALARLTAVTGCGLAAALPAITSRPADLLGRADLGRVAPGCAADLVLLDADGAVARTLINGRIVYDRNG